VFLVTGLLLIFMIAVAGWYMTALPGRNYAGPRIVQGAAAEQMRDELRRHVQRLAADIGERNIHTPRARRAAADYIHAEFAVAATANPAARLNREGYSVHGFKCENVVLEYPGSVRPEQILIVGAHYDTVPGCAGANDNTTGIAAMLVLAQRLASPPAGLTLRFVAFDTEEPPHFHTAQMGSHVHARGCRQRAEQLIGMISLETIGCFSDAPGSQQYPAPFSLLYPSTGNFIALVSNLSSRSFLHRVARSFRRHARIPSQGAAVPSAVTGVDWSDHWSFWQFGYPAIMLTDTAPFRYPHYHEAEDTPDKLDFDGLTLVVEALVPTLRELTSD
jgi:hypothetical protein